MHTTLPLGSKIEIVLPFLSVIHLYMNSEVEVIKAHIALIGCNMVWACDYPFYNLLLGRYIEPLAMVTASLIATALLSLLPLLWEKPQKVERKDFLLLICAALLMGVARKLLMMFGLSKTSPIDGAIIATVSPLMVLVISIIMGLERLSLRRIVGLLLGMAGAIAVVLTSGNPSHIKSQAAGNIMIFCSACVTALYITSFKRLVAKYRITTLLRIIYCTSAVAILPFGIKPMLATNLAAMDTHLILAALFVVFVPTYLPNLLLNYSLKIVQPTVSSIYTYIQPVLAVALSVAMGLDSLHADTLLFATILFAGVWIVVSSYQKQSTNS